MAKTEDGKKLPWLPLDVADYKGDTGHLGALEHGMYLMLIMHYWATGSLPDDDRLLARIACATPSEWRGARPVIEKFFLPGWKHKRVEFELQKARDKSSKRSFAAGEKYALARPPDRANAGANADANAGADGYAMHDTLNNNTSQLHLHKPFILENNGFDVKKREGPPRHCAQTTKNGGRVYVVKGTPEWDAYAADYLAIRGFEPNVNSHGGRWFKTIGEGG